MRHGRKGWLAVAFCLACAAGARAEEHTLGDGAFTLRMDELGRILGLTDHAAGTELVQPRPDAPAWRTRERWGRRDAGQIESSSYPPPAVRRVDGGLRYVWRSPDPARPTVTGRVFYDAPNRQFAFTAEIDNRTKDMVDEIAFPAELGFRPDAGDWALVCTDPKYQSVRKPLDRLEDFATMYIGFAQMQMAGLKIGASGLLAYTDDVDGNVKNFTFRNLDGRVTLEVAHAPRLKPGERRALGYHLMLKPVPGADPNKLAKAYAEWARRQPWAQVKWSQKLAERPVLRRYLEDGFIRWNGTGNSFREDENGKLVFTGPPDFNDYDKHLAAMRERFDKYGLAPGQWESTWTGKCFDTFYPDYWPIEPYMGDYPAFRRELIERRWPTMYHMNPTRWVIGAPGFRREWMASWRGVCYDTAWNWVRRTPVSCTSPGLTLPTELATIRKLADKEGVHGIYLDEFAGGFAIDDNPLSPYSKYPNGYQRAKLAFLKAVRATVKGPAMSEVGTEMAQPYLDFFYGGYGTPEVDHLPLFELVYGDSVVRLNYFNWHGMQKVYQHSVWIAGGIVEQSPGNAVPAMLESSNFQRALSSLAGTWMQAYDEEGNFRTAVWPAGAAVWQRPVEGAQAPADLRHPRLALKGAVRDAFAILADNGDFAMDGAAELSGPEGTRVVRREEGWGSISRAGGRWVLRNLHGHEAPLAFFVSDALWDGGALSGARAGDLAAVDADVRRVDGGWRIAVTLPREEAAFFPDGGGTR